MEMRIRERRGERMKGKRGSKGERVKILEYVFFFQAKAAKEVERRFVGSEVGKRKQGYEKLAFYTKAFSQEMVMKREVIADTGI